MNEEPIVVFGSPRGGTSLVAGVFASQGVWTGKTYPGTEYVNHENQDIKSFMKENWPLQAGLPCTNPEKANLRKFCRENIGTTGLWMFKGIAEYYPIFRHWFPDMTAVFVFRDFTQAVEAMVRRRGERERAEAQRIIALRYTFMEDYLKSGLPIEMVSADAVVQGDFAPIPRILSYYGIAFNQKAAEATLRPDIWHT